MWFSLNLGWWYLSFLHKCFYISEKFDSIKCLKTKHFKMERPQLKSSFSPFSYKLFDLTISQVLETSKSGWPLVKYLHTRRREEWTSSHSTKMESSSGRRRKEEKHSQLDVACAIHSLCLDGRRTITEQSQRWIWVDTMSHFSWLDTLLKPMMTRSLDSLGLGPRKRHDKDDERSLVSVVIGLSNLS